MGLQGWILGIGPQPVVKFDKLPQAQHTAAEPMPPVSSLGCSSDSAVHREGDQDMAVPFMALFAAHQEDPESQDFHNAVDGDVVNEAQLQKLLDDFVHLFTAQPGCMPLMVHKIDTGSHLPIRCQLHPANGRKRDILDQDVDELLSLDLIEISVGPWAIAPVLVGKEMVATGWLSATGHYKCKNESASAPYASDRLGARTARSSRLGLSQGFFQVPIALENRPKTAFIMPQGPQGHISLRQCLPAVLEVQAGLPEAKGTHGQHLGDRTHAETERGRHWTTDFNTLATPVHLSRAGHIHKIC